MNETMKQVRQAFRDHPELRARYEDELNRFAKGKSDPEAVVQAIRDVLGMDITLADLEKAAAAEEELDPEELEQVAGGESDEWCWKDYRCCYIYEDPPDDSASGNT